MIVKYTQEQTFKKEIGGAYQFINLISHFDPPHIHDYYEIFFVTKGQVKHTVNSEVDILPTGSLVFMRPEDCHFLEPFESEECEMINLCFSEDVLYKIIGFYDDELDFDKILNPRIPRTVQLAKAEQAVLYQKFDALNVLNLTDETTFKVNLLYLLNEVIMTSYFSEFINSAKSKSGIPGWLSALCLEMKKPANFIAGTKRMEELCFLSKEHISRSFAKYLNTSPTKYVTDLRMRYAANLLNNSNISIIDIAFNCGYNNLSHFYHLFKQHYGVSPSAFRSKNIWHRK